MWYNIFVSNRMGSWNECVTVIDKVVTRADPKLKRTVGMTVPELRDWCRARGHVMHFDLGNPLWSGGEVHTGPW